ncbi:DNA adenine methylase [uncultured Ruminococcus sp.]|uniref:DNA adenine methylase n=1 Tax=uncultured Ruminococcus sp. TaxID=165186 RepID=UPI0025F32165|nr:DNA adenine methylase [uncultured Ruminococcus sp.]
MYIKTKPFVKWAGGKSQLISEIRKKYPKNIKCYCEPFVGGGAVLFDILANYKPEKVLINDINKELIITYYQLQNNVDNLIKKLFALQNEFISADLEQRKIIYNNNRKLYNSLKNKSCENNELEIASLFIFLNKTCFNGLYRVNKNGDFNVPMGSYKNPLICDEFNLKKSSSLLKNVKIICGDYSRCIDYINDETFVYIDPPYRPLTQTSSFTSYSAKIFDDKEQIRLADFINIISRKGAIVVASNSDPQNADENDMFFDNLYRNYSIKRIQAKRAINSKSEGRGNVSELLISNF